MRCSTVIESDHWTISFLCGRITVKADFVPDAKGNIVADEFSLDYEGEPKELQDLHPVDQAKVNAWVATCKEELKSYFQDMRHMWDDERDLTNNDDPEA